MLADKFLMHFIWQTVLGAPKNSPRLFKNTYAEIQIDLVIA